MSACKSQWRKVLVLLQQMKRQKLLPVAWQIWVARGGVMEVDSLLNADRPTTPKAFCRTSTASAQPCLL